MRNYLIALAAFTLIIFFTFINSSGGKNLTTPTYNESVYDLELAALNRIENRTREASVKVINTDAFSHGSGTYILFHNEKVIFTAAHVVSDGDTHTILDSNGERVSAEVIYRDNDVDFAILRPSEELSVRPFRFRVTKFSERKLIGDRVIFSGYPSHHDLLTTRGEIIGVEAGSILIHSYAWLGSSGSCVFDNNGNFIGILRALGVGEFLVPQLTEDMIYTTPYNSIDWSAARSIVINK
jgi:hypothetical protein